MWPVGHARSHLRRASVANDAVGPGAHHQRGGDVLLTLWEVGVRGGGSRLAEQAGSGRCAVAPGIDAASLDLG